MLKPSALSVRAELPPPEPGDPDAYLPTPEEIARATAEIREAWTLEDYVVRQAMLPDAVRIVRILRDLHCQTCQKPMRAAKHRKHCHDCKAKLKSERESRRRERKAVE